MTILIFSTIYFFIAFWIFFTSRSSRSSLQGKKFQNLQAGFGISKEKGVEKIISSKESVAKSFSSSPPKRKNRTPNCCGIVIYLTPDYVDTLSMQTVRNFSLAGLPFDSKDQRREMTGYFGVGITWLLLPTGICYECLIDGGIGAPPEA